MDLLAGYGSDSSSDSSSASLPKTEAHELKNIESTSAFGEALSRPINAKPQQTRYRRGTKLVSLHSVLPQYILDQLVNGEAQISVDSDEEDETKVTPSTQNPAIKHHDKSLSSHSDAGISLFLKELISTPTTGVAKIIERPTITRSRFERERYDKVDLVPLDETKHNLSTADNSSLPKTEVLDRLSRKFPVTALKRPNNNVTAPRALEREKSQASPVTAVEVETEQLQPSPADMNRLASGSTNRQPTSNKRSRRAMEQALRSGNFSAFSDERIPLVAVEAPAPDGYKLPDWQQSTAVPTHGVKVVPVRMYDPKAGADVVSSHVGGKQRSKHQITQLMVSAAALELKRSRGITGASDVGTAHRADAKRKYGW